MTSTLIHSTGSAAGATTSHSMGSGNNGGTAAISRSALCWSQDKQGFSRLDSKGLKQLWKLIAFEATRGTKPTTTITTNSNRKIKPNQSKDILHENDQNTVNITLTNCCQSQLLSENRVEQNIFSEKVSN